MISRNSPVRHRSKATRFGALTLSALALGGCTDAAGYDLDYILSKAPFVATMRSTVAYESHTMPRLPAEGTVPVVSPMGDEIAPFTQSQLDSVAATLTNPLEATDQVLARGALVYRNQCFSCHGAEGEGNGPVVGNGRFPLGPALTSGLPVGRSDGYLYGVIRVGRGLMPAYGERITERDRWAVVHHLRQLQGQPAPPPADVAAPPVNVQQATEPGQ